MERYNKKYLKNNLRGTLIGGANHDLWIGWKGMNF